MDIEFNCPQCGQGLSVDESAIGSEIQCPECSSTIVIPAPAGGAAPPPRPPAGGPVGAPAPAPKSPSGIVNPMMASAGAKEEKHFVVPQHDTKAEVLIAKPLSSLEVAAKEGEGKLRIKSIRHSECVEVGKDHFDEVVTGFLDKIGNENLVKLSTFNYSHQDLASREWITDYGVLPPAILEASLPPTK